MILARGGIVVAAGHDYFALSGFCRRAVVLDRGTVIADGSFDEVTNGYLAGVHAPAVSHLRSLREADGGA
jgi:ABC-type polysaccharide/polyol phosphate transport system ATPase subunit